jgi:hypothetical protein
MKKIILAIFLIATPFVNTFAESSNVVKLKRANLSEVQRQCIFQASVEFATRAMIEMEKAEECIDRITDYSIRELVKDLVSGFIGGSGGADAQSKAIGAALAVLENHVHLAVDEISNAISHLHEAKVNKIKSEALERCLWFDEPPFFDFEQDLKTFSFKYKSQTNVKAKYQSAHHQFNFIDKENFIEGYITEPDKKFTKKDFNRYMGSSIQCMNHSRFYISSVRDTLKLNNFIMDESAKQECFKLIDAFLKSKSNIRKRLFLIEKTYHILYEQDLKHPHSNILSNLSECIFTAYYECEIPAYEMQRLLVKRKAQPTMLFRYFAYMGELSEIAQTLKTIDEPVQLPKWDWWKDS